MSWVEYNTQCIVPYRVLKLNSLYKNRVLKSVAITQVLHVSTEKPENIVCHMLSNWSQRILSVIYFEVFEVQTILPVLRMQSVCVCVWVGWWVGVREWSATGWRSPTLFLTKSRPESSLFPLQCRPWRKQRFWVEAQFLIKFLSILSRRLSFLAGEPRKMNARQRRQYRERVATRNNPCGEDHLESEQGKKATKEEFYCSTA